MLMLLEMFSRMRSLSRMGFLVYTKMVGFSEASAGRLSRRRKKRLTSPWGSSYIDTTISSRDTDGIVGTLFPRPMANESSRKICWEEEGNVVKMDEHTMVTIIRTPIDGPRDFRNLLSFPVDISAQQLQMRQKSTAWLMLWRSRHGAMLFDQNQIRRPVAATVEADCIARSE